MKVQPSGSLRTGGTGCTRLLMDTVECKGSVRASFLEHRECVPLEGARMGTGLSITTLK